MKTLRSFCSGHPSKWAAVLPRSADVVKYINENLEKRPGVSGTFASVDRQAFVSEYSFRLAKNLWERSVDAIEIEELDSTWATEESVSAYKYVSKLAGVISGGWGLNPTDAKSVVSQTRSILKFVHEESSDDRGAVVVFRPDFPGCGSVADCQGDIMIGNNLWELKATRYGYTSVNLRQILCYATLDWLAKKYQIQRLGFFNPVNLTYFVSEAARICESCAALESPHVFELIASMMETGGDDVDVNNE